MDRRRYIVWTIAFSAVAVLLGALATTWNYALIDMAHTLRAAGQIKDLPWYWIILGTAGFCIVLAGLVVFFVRLIFEIRKNQMQSEYLARVSHELKTPLATMELSSSLLRSMNLDPQEASQLWQSHQRELGRLKSNVDSLLMAAQFDAKLFRPQRVLINLEQWIEKQWGLWQGSLEGGEVRRQGQSLSGQIKSDPHYLNLITDNLVANTRKYAKNTPQLTIHTNVTYRRGRKVWQLIFEDFGLGFDPEMEKKIFKPFVRSIVTREKNIPGTGLGLYLAGSAARRMGYRLWAESKGIGQGARFTLEGTFHE